MQAQSLGSLIAQGVKPGLYPSVLSHSVISSDLIASLCTIAIIEGLIGMALVGGAAAVGTLLIANLIRRATRK